MGFFLFVRLFCWPEYLWVDPQGQVAFRCGIVWAQSQHQVHVLTGNLAEVKVYNEGLLTGVIIPHNEGAVIFSVRVVIIQPETYITLRG